MTLHPGASPGLIVAFSSVVALTIALFWWAVWRAARPQFWRVVAGTVAWLAVFGLVALSGFFAQFDARPPPPALIFVSVFGMGVWLGRSALAQRLVQTLPLWAVVAFLGFRLPLELVMHAAAVEGTMPVEMSYAGYNLDILTGISALATAVALRRGAKLWVARAFNLLGSVLLAVIVAVAFLATPMIHAFGDGAHLNTWVAYFPFIYLPVVCVVAALATHVALWRRLGTALVLLCIGLLCVVPATPAQAVECRDPPGQTSLDAVTLASAVTPTSKLTLDSLDDRPPPPPKTTTTRTRSDWYGWQSLVIDGAADALMVAGSLSRGSSGPVVALGAVAHVVGGPIVHFAHGNGTGALISAGLRLGGPLVLGGVTAGVTAAICRSASSDCGYAAFGFGIIGFLLGVPASQIIDATVFGYEPVPLEPARASMRFSVVPTPDGRGMGMGLAGVW